MDTHAAQGSEYNPEITLTVGEIDPAVAAAELPHGAGGIEAQGTTIGHEGDPGRGGTRRHGEA